MAKPSPAAALPPQPAWLVEFGHRLKRERIHAGLTQRELAAPAVSKSFISLLETARSYPSIQTVVALGRRLNVAPTALLLDADDLRHETALCLLHLAWGAVPAGQGPEALRLLEAAVPLFRDVPMDIQVRVLTIRARVAMAAGELEAAARVAGEAAAVAARHRLDRARGWALALKGVAEERSGEYKAASVTLERAIALMTRSTSLRTEEGVWALLSLGAVRGRTGQWVQAARAYRQALRLATRLRMPTLRGRALTGLGLVAWTRQRLDQAVEYFESAYDVFDGTEDLTEMGRVLSNLGLVRREQGLHAEALAVLQKALRVRGRQRDIRGRSATLDEIARTLLAMNRRGEAARTARRAINDARVSGDRSREAIARVTLARALRAQGHLEEAIALLRTAVATLTRLGMDAHAVSASAELDIWLDQTGPGAGAAGEGPTSMARRLGPA